MRMARRNRWLAVQRPETSAGYGYGSRAVLSGQAQSTSSAQLSLSYVQASDCPPHGRVARTGARGLAEQEGASKQEIIRKVVLERYERSACERRVAGAAARMVARWGDVLDRLGSA